MIPKKGHAEDGILWYTTFEEIYNTLKRESPGIFSNETMEKFRLGNEGGVNLVGSARKVGILTHVLTMMIKYRFVDVDEKYTLNEENAKEYTDFLKSLKGEPSLCESNEVKYIA